MRAGRSAIAERLPAPAHSRIPGRAGSLYAVKSLPELALVAGAREHRQHSPVNGLNVCTPDGSAESPQLAWSHAPHGTRSFVVVLYDTTAAFTHWGMYNIPHRTHELPQNAGVANSAFGSQIDNDFGDPHYDGPCPPAGVAPFAHHYVFTVYALDTQLTLQSSANFPANAETLYHALIRAGREGHILASASITGLFSSTPSD